MLKNMCKFKRNLYEDMTKGEIIIVFGALCVFIAIWTQSGFVNAMAFSGIFSIIYGIIKVSSDYFDK